MLGMWRGIKFHHFSHLSRCVQMRIFLVWEPNVSTKNSMRYNQSVVFHFPQCFGVCGVAEAFTLEKNIAENIKEQLRNGCSGPMKL